MRRSAPRRTRRRDGARRCRRSSTPSVASAHGALTRANELPGAAGRPAAPAWNSDGAGATSAASPALERRGSSQAGVRAARRGQGGPQLACADREGETGPDRPPRGCGPPGQTSPTPKGFSKSFARVLHESSASAPVQPPTDRKGVRMFTFKLVLEHGAELDGLRPDSVRRRTLAPHRRDSAVRARREQQRAVTDPLPRSEVGAGERPELRPPGPRNPTPKIRYRPVG